jgi:tRNA(fMet)-specific endonuclease VapC
MLDTNICSYIMRKQPASLLQTLQLHSDQRDSIFISAITYAELRFGAIGRKASPKHNLIVDEFVERVDHVLPYDQSAVERTAELRQYLAGKGMPIGANDSMIAGNALAADCILVTNNTREFCRVPGLIVENWVRS